MATKKGGVASPKKKRQPRQRLLNPSRAAELLDVSWELINRAIVLGEIPSIEYECAGGGIRYLVDHREVVKFRSRYVQTLHGKAKRLRGRGQGNGRR